MEGLEKYLSKRVILSNLLLFLLSLTCITPVFAQSSSTGKIRFSMWAPLEAYPGTKEAALADDNVFSYPISRLKTTAPFFIEGMVCGWEFTYTPSDNIRNVSEHFEFAPLYSISSLKQTITYKEPWIQDNRLYCWVEYQCSPQVNAWRNAWQTSGYRKISGNGIGLLTDGFDGIKFAAQEALKTAVRDYARGITKNKPRKITGEVMISNAPVIGIKSGRYTVYLDFYLNINNIIWYNTY